MTHMVALAYLKKLSKLVILHLCLTESQVPHCLDAGPTHLPGRGKLFLHFVTGWLGAVRSPGQPQYMGLPGYFLLAVLT